MHSLNQLSLSYVKWFSKLLRRISSLCPGPVLGSFLLYLINQACQVLMVFVPLKLLIILGKDSLPAYVTRFLPGMDKSTLITNLGIIAIGILITYLLTEWSIHRIANATAKKLVLSSNKLSLFDDQEDFSKDVFTKVTRTLGGTFMFFAGLALGMFLDWRIFTVLICIILLEYIYISNKWRGLLAPNKLFERSQLIKNRQNKLNLIGNVNFAVTIAMLFWFFVTQDYDIIIGILVIILARQITMRFNLVCNDGFFIFQKQPRISALFFSDVQLIESSDKQQDSFISLFLPGEREKILFEIDSECSIAIDSFHWRWADSSVKNVVLLQGKAKSTVDDKSTSSDDIEIMLKLYPKQSKRHFSSDKLFLSEMARKHPLVPDFITSGNVSGCSYTLIAGPLEKEPPIIKRNELVLRCVEELWAYCPDDSIADRLARSSPAKFEVLSKADFNLLDVCFESPPAELITFRAKLSEILDYIRRLPHFVYNKDMSECNVRIHNGKLKLLNWHNVSLEPVGFGLANNLIRKEGESLLHTLKNSRQDCADLTLSSLVLVALLSDLTKSFEQQRYDLCLKEIIDIVETAKDCLDL